MPLPIAPYLYTTSPQQIYPLTDGVTVTTVGGGGYQNSLWVTIHPATPQAWLITALVAAANNGGLGVTEFDLGVGAAGSEVVVATIAHFQASNAVLPLAIPGAWVPAGSRLAVRVRSETPFSGFLYYVNVLYLAQPADGRIAAPATPLRLAPSVATGSPAGAVLLSGGTPWANGAWVTLSGATASLWAVAGVQILPLHTVSSVPASLEIDLGAGETVLTTIRWASLFNNFKPTTIALVWPLLVIPPGTALTARVRTNTSLVDTVRVKLQYYADLTGLDGLTTTQPTEWFPSAAEGLTLTPPSGGWVNSPWVVAGADSAPLRAVTEIALDHVPVTGEHEVDLGAGGIGAEVVASTFRFAADQVLDNGSDHTTLPLLVAQRLAASTLLSLRARSAQTASGDTTLRGAIGYITTPDFALALDAPQYTYIPAADGPSLTVTNVAWTNSPWGLLTASVAQDILLTGVTITYDSPATFVDVDFGVGALGSEQAFTTVRALVNNNTLNWWMFTVPHYVPAGTRLSVRFRQASATVNTRGLGATYLVLGPGGGIPPGTPTGCTPGFPAGHVPIFPYQ